MATVVGAASNPLSNPIVSMVDGVSSKAFDEVLKATPPALSVFLASLPSIEAKEKSPQLDDGDSGLPPRDDDGGGGGGGGGGGNWSSEFFLFGFLAFLGFLKDKESEEDYRDSRRR
ncbi:protein YELLOW LEAF 1, choloroplastic [Gossypium raimondii]|uniref:Uncharacterized protein n=1 Tax=Gossypium raimondii TaxID=29730 RepID=A0A0D2T6A1_GOSRA|nr:protein YELLOW LEAF 1, choloroplastic [Gossypium raimondii]XP_012438093.1 protein YELLOW LEAF 1, choloroplastic [Gossypium raimondii]XP_052480783.1 protein YELLOW LEAF 1, choloroplastic [Gossypium raimondii]XP_052480785.1 protein YELLOW LEAF 1, choloroplastic [Gossypium raimondii]XP_052480786.1 protein YELLOW LEAF 1, choloroplastic [Gossypium raimondii]KJB49980.1 hypothetical protein B456_008G148200 [Gossypium raimondii]KJB49981.1 hypothetical protein B456_008G148200 [Gossypium raimondii]